MLLNKTIAVVVAAYNEETQIGQVIETMPVFVDRIIVVNDCSTDSTIDVVKQYISNDNSPLIKIPSILNQVTPNRYNRADLVFNDLLKKDSVKYTPVNIYNKNPDEDRIILIHHQYNAGKGACVATGYKWARDHGIDCIATMDGDGQMDPDELESICLPVVQGEADYVKGNRLIHRSALLVIPKVRYFGNAILSILTKVASGYWHVSDTQTGFTAISNKALNAIHIHKIYKNYGIPNDMLVKLNIASCTIKEVEIKPIYSVGEKSKMKIARVIPSVSWLLFRSFFRRLWHKYLFRDFHPLFLLYHFAFILFFASIPFVVKITNVWLIQGEQLNPITFLAFIFLFISSFQSFMFAMWMDIQDNERLQK